MMFAQINYFYCITALAKGIQSHVGARGLLLVSPHSTLLPSSIRTRKVRLIYVCAFMSYQSQVSAQMVNDSSSAALIDNTVRDFLLTKVAS